jgi:hypothetical protein
MFGLPLPTVHLPVALSEDCRTYASFRNALYINSLISQFAVEETFLYRHGFLDGIKALKYIGKL